MLFRNGFSDTLLRTISCALCLWLLLCAFSRCFFMRFFAKALSVRLLAVIFPCSLPRGAFSLGFFIDIFPLISFAGSFFAHSFAGVSPVSSSAGAFSELSFFPSRGIFPISLSSAIFPLLCLAWSFCLLFTAGVFPYFFAEAITVRSSVFRALPRWSCFRALVRS